MKFNFKDLSKEKKQGLILISIGFILISAFTGYRFHQVRILSFWKNPTIVNSEERKGVLPVFIKSFPLGVNIKVKESSIVNDVWQTFPDAVSHLNTSGRIGEGGNIIIYGHNKNEILGPIRWAKEGEKIELIGEDGKSYLYIVVKTATVDPNNLEYILPQNEETLTVYTCIGFFDSQRFVAIAKPEKK